MIKSSSLAALLIGALASSPLTAVALSAKISASRGIPWTLGPAPRPVPVSDLSRPATFTSARLSVPLLHSAHVVPTVEGLSATPDDVAAPHAGPAPLVSLKTLAVSAGASARFFFDGGANSLRPDNEPVPDPGSTKAFLDGRLAEAREALSGTPRLREALQAIEVIFWSKEYLAEEEYDAWLLEHRRELWGLDAALTSAMLARIEAEFAEGDVASVRDIFDDLDSRHSQWTKAHEEDLRLARARLPSTEGKAEPLTPIGEADRLAETMRGHRAMGNWRQVAYYLKILKDKHPRWLKANKREFTETELAYRHAVYKAFEEKKARFAPVEARRLQEYARALADARNLGFGFAQPTKQDPQALMCTVLSICNALQATIGFADPTMDAAKFTEVVRTILKDPEIGVTRGISTNRMRVLMRELGLPLKVIEMQERLRRPFEEEELRRLVQPNQVVIPVFTIVQKYPDERGLLVEEHKGFLRDAFWSPTEKEWVYLIMDPLIGRTTFYTWSEMKVFLHKLFVIKVDKPLSAPKNG